MQLTVRCPHPPPNRAVPLSMSDCLTALAMILGGILPGSYGRHSLSGDLLVYLRSSVGHLVEQIQKRGRDYEESIRLDYLNRLNERYEAWISTYTKGKVLVINVDNMDFEHNPEQLGDIITKVDAELNGLF